MAARLEAFVRPGEPASERVIEAVAEPGIAEHVLVRDARAADALAELRRLGGDHAPALWDGERLFSGAEAVLARLRAFLDVGRAD